MDLTSWYHWETCNGVECLDRDWWNWKRLSRGCSDDLYREGDGDNGEEEKRNYLGLAKRFLLGEGIIVPVDEAEDAEEESSS